MVAGVTAAMRAANEAGGTAALFAALARSQRIAAVSTALYRNQLIQRTNMNGTDQDGAHDFDFCFGRWRVHNERLRERLAGSNDWECFEALQECRPILGGLGNIDEFVSDEFGPARFFGLTLRLFDRATRQWRIWWASNRGGRLEPPVAGRFAGGVGHFEGDDVHGGRPVRVRFVWSDIGPDRARWEQAFSADGGRSWETNWRMHMTRLAGHVPVAGERT